MRFCHNYINTNQYIYADTDIYINTNDDADEYTDWDTVGNANRDTN